MAGDWLKMDTDLPEKPEVWQIAGLLKLDPDAVVGKLFKVWRWFDKHTESGNAANVTYPLLDSLVGVTGFAEAMVFAGWLEQHGRDLRLPKFDRHNGKTAKNRALTAKRVAKIRNDDVTLDALAREEKRREEEKQKKGAGAPVPRRSSKAKGITFAEWIADLGDAEAIPADDPVFRVADDARLPREFVRLAWAWFERTYGRGGPREAKQQAGASGWRQTFRNAIEGGWPKYWACSQAGEWYLTPAGIVAQRALA